MNFDFYKKKLNIETALKRINVVEYQKAQ